MSHVDQVLRACRYVTFDDLWRFLCLPDEVVITEVIVDVKTRTMRVETMGDGDPLTDGMEAPMKLWVSEHMSIVQELAASDPLMNMNVESDPRWACSHCLAGYDDDPEVWSIRQRNREFMENDHRGNCLWLRAKRLVEQ